MTASNLLLIVTTICTALIAGLFYSYSCSVMLGLKMLPDNEFILAMQSINRSIQNPVFFISFVGTLLLLPFTTYVNYSQPTSTRFWLLLVATIVYITGVICVTALGNIPLNNTLDKFNLASASADAVQSQRASFETTWNNLNTVRTISSLISLVLVIIGCVKR